MRGKGGGDLLHRRPGALSGFFVRGAGGAANGYSLYIQARTFNDALRWTVYE